MSGSPKKNVKGTKFVSHDTTPGHFVRPNSGTKQPKSVKGGLIYRDAKTGRFIEVQTENGATRASSKSLATVKGVSEKRSAALRRLANR